VEDRATRVNWTIIECLAKIRSERGLSLQALADQAGVDRSYVGLLEKHKSRPTLEVALRLAYALGVSLPRLIEDAEKACGDES